MKTVIQSKNNEQNLYEEPDDPENKNQYEQNWFDDVWKIEIKYQTDRFTEIVITEYHEPESYNDAITCSNAIKW